MTIAEKVARFRALHSAPGAFLIPNPWDAGSARMLEGLGFQALATSSWATAASLGRKDYGITRDDALRVAQQVVDAVEVPVSADLENGFGDSPAAAAETIALAVKIGLAGGSIEDASGDARPYDIELAAERVAAAAARAKAAAHGFVLTARAENFLRGVPDLKDTIRRLQAYERAGADVLFAPGLPDLASIRAVCAAVSKPVNSISGMKGRPFSVAELEAVGVKRISLAAGFYRAAMTGLRDAAREAIGQGTFSFAERTMTSVEFAPYLR